MPLLILTPITVVTLAIAVVRAHPLLEVVVLVIVEVLVAAGVEVLLVAAVAAVILPNF